jgi:3-oxoadipate enol-lactonase
LPSISTKDGVQIAYDVTGSDSGPTIVFAHALGTNRSIWDDVFARLPIDLRLIRYDLRGHGASDAPDGPYAMGTLISDAEAVCDALNIRDCVFVGLSVGGMIAQGLAIKRLDIVRGLVLSNTAAKIGNPKLWNDRIRVVQEQGLANFADDVLARWFRPEFCETPQAQACREMIIATSRNGYTATCAAISGTDFYTPTSGLRLPTLGIAGSDDRSTPADLVRETIDLIPGADFALIRRSGHLPCVDQPDVFADYLTAFLNRIGHL